jgi:hypothetical protein
MTALPSFTIAIPSFITALPYLNNRPSLFHALPSFLVAPDPLLSHAALNFCPYTLV